jgi:LPXTG-motif cell wall-anchored protein
VDTVCSITEESSVRYTTTVNAENADSICFAVTTEATPVTFVNTLVTTEFTVTKEWQGSDGGVISLTLYADGQKMDPQPDYSRNDNTYTFTNLPKYNAQGQAVVYSAKEDYMDGYMTIYKNVAPYESESSFIYNGGTIVNRAVTDIAVRKVWTGMDENEEHPEITLTLYCNGQKIDKQAKVDKNGWYHFYNLPLRESPYYVVEEPVDGYATSYENVGSYAGVTDCVYDGGTITNHKLPKTMDSQPLALYAGLLIVALAGIGLCLKKRKQD